MSLRCHPPSRSRPQECYFCPRAQSKHAPAIAKCNLACFCPRFVVARPGPNPSQGPIDCSCAPAPPSGTAPPRRVPFHSSPALRARPRLPRAPHGRGTTAAWRARAVAPLAQNFFFWGAVAATKKRGATRALCSARARHLASTSQGVWRARPARAPQCLLDAAEMPPRRSRVVGGGVLGVGCPARTSSARNAASLAFVAPTADASRLPWGRVAS